MLEQIATMTDHRPMTVLPALKTYLAALRRERHVSPELCAVLDAIISRPSLGDTVTGFELVVNCSLDHGYKGEALLAFVFQSMNRRFAARIQRRLKHSTLGARTTDVEDLVMTSIEGVHRLFVRSERTQHTVTYALLLSIADHRAIDFLRRKRADLVDCVDGKIEGEHSELLNRWRPDLELENKRVNEQLRILREVILGAVNELKPMERQALILVEVQGLGYHDVASKLGIKSTDVGNFVRRTRKLRDRNFIAGLRACPDLEGHIGFAALQSNRELRTNLLRWAAEIGDGFCFRCLHEESHLHTADQACTAAVTTVRGQSAMTSRLSSAMSTSALGI